MPNALYVLNPSSYDLIYGEDERRDIAARVTLCGPPQTAQDVKQAPAVLADVELLFSGWGAPVLDEALLAAAPRLRMVFYGAGSIRTMMTPAAWDRGLRVTSAYAANAVPVVEYTLSQILWCLKRGWHYVLTGKRTGARVPRVPVAGAYGSTVGIVSLGMIGQRVCRMLQAFDLRVIAYDPFVPAEVARDLHVELVSLEELFSRADVVSLHTPWLKETEGLITGAHFRAMRENASFINTARGAVVREPEMIEVLQARPDLTAVLDVTYPEPPRPDSPLYALPNVVLTPHIAGSMDGECRRMGRYMVQELERYLAGQPLAWEISRERAEHMA